MTEIFIEPSPPGAGVKTALVTAYGAKGDGVTDDRTAIQAAFTAACRSGGGKTVSFPAGSYYVGTHTGSTNIFDLSTLGDGISIRTSGFVELVCTTGTLNSIPRFFYLANNSHFDCDPIHFRDLGGDQTDAVVNAGDQKGAVGFYIQNATPANWGSLYFTKIYAQNMVAAMLITQKSGAAATSASRIRNIAIGQIVCNECYYAINCQNDGDNLFLGELYNTLGRRAYYVYGVSNHTVTIHDYNTRGSTGKCYIARQVGGLNTTGLNIRYRNRGNAQSGTVLVAIDHIDLLGGEISGVTVDVDVKESSASYIPVKFRNYSGSGGSETSSASSNYTQDIRLSGSCDSNAQACTTTTNISYAAKRPLHWIDGQNFTLGSGVYSAFNVNGTHTRAGTPTWKGDTTDPAIGNGTLTYDADVVHNVATVSIQVAMGSTTTVGSGSWYFQIPGLTATTTSVGTCLFLDSGTAFHVGVCRINAGQSAIYLYAENAALGVRGTVPFTWASGDQLTLTITFAVTA